MMRRAIAALILVIAALGTVPGAAAAQSQPAILPAGGGAEPRLTLIEQPIAVAADGSFGVYVAAQDAPDATEIVVDVYPRVEAGDVVGVEPDGGPEASFDPVALSAGDPDDQRTAGFSIELYRQGEPRPDPAWGYRLDEPGVYPVRIRLQDGNGNRFAILMTSIIRLPAQDESVTQTGAAVLIDIHRPLPTDEEARATPDHANRELLSDLSPVLAALAERPQLPATFSVTPDTAARIAGDPDAAEELAALRTELTANGRSVMDAPYVDLDPASLVRAKLGDELTRQRDLGRQTLGELLATPSAGTWQLEHRVTTAALEAMRSRGIFRALLPGDAMTSGAGVLEPVDLPAGEGQVRAVAVSQVYGLGQTADGDPVLDAHRLLARLAAAGAGPEAQPNVVVSIDPADATKDTLRIVLDALQLGTPFFAATTVKDLFEATPSSSTAQLAPATPAPLGTYPADVLRAKTALASYQAMVSGRGELIRPYGLRLATSAAADLKLVERRRDATWVTDTLHEPFTSISMPAKDKVTLGARDAQFPVPIESKLDYPVKAVIELEANDRLEFPKDRIETTIQPGRQVVKLRVRTRAPGATPVRITVRSPEGGVVLAESQYSIQSTAVSGVGIILTVGAALFLALWWGRHWHRHRGTERHARPGTLRPRTRDGSTEL